MSGQCMCDVCARLGQPSHNQALGNSCRSQSLQIDRLRPSFHHFSSHSAHWDENVLPQETLQRPETDSIPHTLTVAPHFQSMMEQLNASMEINEMKPRLGKDEVDILECEFKKNPKPTTMTKRQFAEDMGVDLSRINNWFQNRRAKHKQERKQEAYEAGQAQDALGQYSQPSSPGLNYANIPIYEPTATFGLPSGLPPPVTLYNPQYSDPSTTSMESLHRTLAAAPASENSISSSLAIAFNDVTESDKSSTSPLAPSNPFRSPPPPMDIASRRKKVQHKPAALMVDTLRSSRPSLGPRTVSHAEGFRRPMDSPVSSPMRRIISAGGNSIVLPGRVYKHGVESAQHSPINSINFPEASFIERNCHTLTIRQPPSLTEGSSLNNILAPSTPTLPREREMTLVKKETSKGTVSPKEGSMTFVFNAGTGAFNRMEGDRDLESPPGAPQAQMVMHPSASNSPAMEISEKQWSFEVPDEPLWTPAHDTFPLEINLPQPPYLASMSQVLAPTFGHFNPNFSFMYSENANRPVSRINKQTSTLAESKINWHFDTPDEPQYILMGLDMPQPSYMRATKPKTFEFSHTTVPDFSEDDFLDKCKPYRHSTNSASEDRGEQPQPIETGLSPVLTVFDEERSANDSTKVEEVKIKVEIDCHPEVNHEDEDVSEGDSCSSYKTELFGSSYMKACNAPLKSVLDREEDEQDDLTLSILDPMRQALVGRIMEEFYLILNQDWAAQVTQCPGGCSSTSGDGKDCGTLVDKVSLPTSQQKRQRSYKEDSADESGNRKPRRQRGGPRLPSERSNPARFACPFRKHNPQKYGIYSHRVCALTSWDTIARVKEHLYRNHKAAPYCKRCWEVFETEELLDSHATVPATSICEALPGHPPEGITPKQVAELRSKARPYSRQNEADRWKEIFGLLFPSESVPSPYWEPVQEHVPTSPNSQVLVRYDDYMHRELPRLFRSRVEEVVRREIQPVEASLLANLEGLIRECQDQLSSRYRETHITEQQSEVSTTQPIETLAGPVNLNNTAENLRNIATETDQQSSSDFFDAVLQPPPPQEEDYVLDFSASNTELSDPYEHTPSGNLSDSGYVSVPRCSCKELCRCLTSMIDFGNRDVDISEPSFVDLSQDLEAQAHGVQWQNWLENRD